MRHSLYVNNRKHTNISYVNKPTCIGRSGFPRNSETPFFPNTAKSDRVLETAINAALKRNSDNPEIRSEILNRVGMYRIIAEIARNYRDKKAIETLKRELANYLNII